MKSRLSYVSILILLSGCATPNRLVTKEVPIMPVRVPGTTIPSSEYDTLRNGEVIKSYYSGAFVDPNNPNIRHDPHAIQRREQAATWNLRPNVPVVAGGPTYVAAASAARNSALTEQLSGALDRQKGYTDALTQQNEKLQEIIAELKAASDREAIAKEATEAELRATVQTLKELKQELQKAPEPQPTPSPSSTPKPKGLFNNIFGADGHATGQAAPTPQPEPPNPTVSLLVDTLDMHIAALERPQREGLLTSGEDVIDLDALYAPLTKVADAHRKH
jgi:hypothetical protein